MLNPRIKADSKVPLIIGVVCVFVLTVGAQGPRKDQSSVDKFPAKQSVSLFKLHQLNSPIAIKAMTIVDDPDDGKQMAQFTIENTSDKPILIMALKYSTDLGMGGHGTIEAGISPNRQHTFKPGEVRKAAFDLSEFDKSPESLTISVDFVEFLDGTRWGSDGSQYGEKVDGIRAGVRAEIDLLMKILKTEGLEAVIRSLDSITTEADQSITRSEEWLFGFRSGVAWVRGNIRRKGKSLAEVEKELRYGFDLPVERK